MKIKIILLILLFSLFFIKSSCKEEAVSTRKIDDDNIFLKSTDNGVTWISRSIGFEVDKLRSITIVSEGTLIAAGGDDNGSGSSVLSTDFGANWITENLVHGTPNFPPVIYTSIASGRKDWAVTVTPGNSTQNNFSSIKLTTNGGASWISINEITGLNAVSFRDGENGIIVGNFGNILKTENGGLNWMQVQSNVTTDLLDVALLGNNGFAVGMLGTILKTSDGGSTWMQQSSNVQNTLNGVCFYYETYGAVAVGTNGKILRTVNSGIDWEAIPVENQNTLNDVTSNLSGTIVSAGAGGTILKSTNYGVNWEAQNSNTTRNLNGIFFRGLYYIVGD
jgi:photosystem II stability/assembly factor-like uncharacterized protein